MASAVNPQSGGTPPAVGVPRRLLERDLFRLLVEAVVDYAIFMISPEGIIRTWNAGAERIKGYRSDEAIGRHFSLFYSAEDIEAGKPAVELEIASRLGRLEDEGWRVRKDGSRFWANVVITAILDDQGKLVGFGKVTRDLTARKRLEEAHARFIANAAHELRTPLAVIVGMISFMQSTPAAAESIADHLETIGRQTDRMHVLVNNLLDLSKLEEGGDRFALQPVDPAELFEHVVVSFPPPEGKRIDRDFGGLAVLAEPRRLEQVFVNLLVNAYRYGGSTVRVRARAEDMEVVVEFADDGPGVETSVKDHVFEPFRRGRDTPSGEGSGLGLAIVKGFVEAFGGTVTLDRSADGARFLMRLQRG